MAHIVSTIEYYYHYYYHRLPHQYSIEERREYAFQYNAVLYIYLCNIIIILCSESFTYPLPQPVKVKSLVIHHQLILQLQSMEISVIIVQCHNNKYHGYKD